MVAERARGGRGGVQARYRGGGLDFLDGTYMTVPQTHAASRVFLFLRGGIVSPALFSRSWRRCIYLYTSYAAGYREYMLVRLYD